MTKSKRSFSLCLILSLAGLILSTTTFVAPKFVYADFDLPQFLQAHVYKLSHDIGNRSMEDYGNLMNAETYITEQLRSFGYEVTLQEFDVEGKTVRNIISTRIGVNSNDKIYLVGAHYDTFNNPGADDNASGVAVMLEIARVMATVQNNKTLKFVAFVNEEDPYGGTEEMGSIVYVKKAKENGENILGAIILDMVGYYPNNIKYLSVGTDMTSMELANQIVQYFPKDLSFSINILKPGSEGFDESDHSSFWQGGYPAIMITGPGFDYEENWHKPSDTHEKLNYQNMAQVVEGIEEALNKFLISCTYSISPTSASVSAAGRSGSVSVTAPSGCSWTASTNSGSWDWLGISSGWSGTGNGTVNWYAFANNSTGQRIGTLTIAGQTFTVTQSGVQGSGISIISPNGGENWKVGTTQTINWSYIGGSENYVKIELLKGGTVNRTITYRTSIGNDGSGSYSWRIPRFQTQGSDYKIRVTSMSNSSNTDTSDNNFTIIK